GKLAGFLALAAPAVRREVLDGVAARDEGLARSAREALLLFEDLPKLSEASVRQVVTTVDPAVVALAVVGAPEIRDLVLGSVSKRLRGILEVEEEVVKEKPAIEIDAARRVVEEAMRRLADRGDLKTRVAA
ncbi:MAG TPA: FliG C-terminal domain-containing protein, partial [Anaeromyxobacter sp.]